MITLLTEALNFIADDILRLRRYISPIDKITKLCKKDFQREHQYLHDFDFMMHTIEDCVLINIDPTLEAERQMQMKETDRYMQLQNKIFERGPQSLAREEIDFLETYIRFNDIK